MAESSAPPAAAPPAALNAAAPATPLLVGSGTMNLQCKKTAEGVCLGRSGGETGGVFRGKCYRAGAPSVRLYANNVGSVGRHPIFVAEQPVLGYTLSVATLR